MIHLRTALATALALLTPAWAQADPGPREASQWLAAIAGRYEGELQNGQDFVPVTTELRQNESGTIEGSYVFVERVGRKEGGELTNCKPTRAKELACRWYDRYGSGPLVLTFDNGLRSFQGRWSASGSAHWLPWGGVRTRGASRRQ